MFVIADGVAALAVAAAVAGDSGRPIEDADPNSHIVASSAAWRW